MPGSAVRRLLRDVDSYDMRQDALSNAQSPELLPKLIEQLARKFNYRLDNPEALALLKTALYAFAVSPTSPLHALFFPPESSRAPAATSIDQDFTLTEAQSKASGGVNLGEYSASRRGKLCGHVFKPGESVYRCRDCALDATCVLCSKCFHGSSHAKQGHDVTMSVHVGVGAGCCDCGDAEAFKDGCHLDCKYHSLSEGPTSQVRSPETEQALVELGRILRTWLDWMVQVLERMPSSATPPPQSVEEFLDMANEPGSETPLASTAASRSWLESGSTAHMLETPDGTIQQHVISADSPRHHAPRELEDHELPEADEQDFAREYAGHSHTDDGQDNDEDYSVTSNTAARPYRSSISRGKARADSADPGPWTVVLWNDEKHSFDQVIGQVHRCGVPRQEASDIAIKVDSYGRSPVITSSSADSLVRAARIISSIELAVTISDSMNMFREHVAGELVTLMRDLCTVNLGEEGGLVSEVLVEVLLEKAPDGLSRFQKLLTVDERLWKKARKDLAELFVVLLGVSHEAKVNFSVQYAGMYASIAESYLLSDREPEHSIIFFGVQVFTVPSVSALLIEVGFFSRVLSILYAFFTEQTLPDDKKKLVLPPNRNVKRIRLSSSIFRQKRYFQIFSDLNHLISSSVVHAIIAKEPGLLEDLVYLLQLFTAMNPNERATQTHIEFETDTWVTAFNVTIQLGKICRSFGQAFHQSSAEFVLRAAGFLLEKMAETETAFTQVTFAGKQHELVECEVASSSVSFHHPLSWLFAEIMKGVPQLARMASSGLAPGLPADITLHSGMQKDFLVAMDQPLTVIALVGQIKAGVWVRNGFGIRAQQLHYKEYSLRENTFDQDLFFLQTSLVMVEPELVLASIVSRFDLLSASSDMSAHSTYDEAQTMTMWEELLHLLITLLSEPTYSTGMSDKDIMRRELVHNLCLGPSTYSDLMRRLSERFADDASVDKTLADVSTFKAPTGTADQGTYTLRTENYALINPYFSRFTRNQREEAEKIVREQLSKLTGEREPVIVPTRLDLLPPFAKLINVFDCDTLHYIIYRTLCVGRPRTADDTFSEVLVDEALQLCMLALVEKPDAFASAATSTKWCEYATREIPGINKEEFPATLLHVLVEVETHDKLKAVRHKARWVLDRLSEIVGSEVVALRGSRSTSSEDALEAKRAAAKARQAAIMKQFAQAQQTFFESVDDDEDEDEDVGMEDDTETGTQPTSLGACIVCQDDLNSAAPFGALTMIQSTNIIRSVPAVGSNEMPLIIEETLAMPSSFDKSATDIRPFGRASRVIPVDADDESGDGLSQGFPSNLTTGALYASACGHMMHLNCFDSYYKSIEQRHQVQPTRCHPENTSRNEFTCPLCKSLGNVLMPVTVESETFPADSDDTDLAKWAQDWSDPINMFVEQGASTLEAQEMLRKSDLLLAERKRGLKPWRISLTLPTMLPREFAAGEPLMTHRMLQVLDPLVQEMYGPGVASFLPEEVAKTISVLEIAARGSGESMSELSESTVRMIKSFFIIFANLIHVQTGDVQSLVSAALATFPRLGGIFIDQHQQQNIVLSDPLVALVSLASVTPADFFHYVAFAFYNELVLLWLSWTSRLDNYNNNSSTSVELDADTSGLALMLTFLEATEAHNERQRQLKARMMLPGALAFLRRAAIVHRVLFGSSAMTASQMLPNPSGTEFERLTELLRIPKPNQVFATDTSLLSAGALEICRHVNVFVRQLYAVNRDHNDFTERRQELATSRFVPNRSPELEHHTMYELIGLPRQLDTLSAFSMQNKCQRCNTVPTNPCLCLMCGQVVCGQSYCCMDSDGEAQHGECNVHMWSCGGSVGIFYFVKNNCLLYLYAGKGTFANPPYLDSHGEVDSGGRSRGRNQFPQFLHQSRYDEVRKIWLTHQIPTLVARKLEASTNHGGWETI
ncbi:E3 ubiquitin-protein ligase ubr1 [Microbotryomycetes sp. JL221]|nr:E3 ubiquitin-protein ligase ubr1 [Microbotryomycetes sp. JL221]